MANNKDLVGSKIKAKPRDKEKIGIDVDNTLAKEILDAAMSSSLNISSLDNFSTVAQTREQIYQLIDTMAADSTIAAILETYAEDVCEPNDSGAIVWCESSDDNVAQYVSFLLDSMNVDKHVYSWVYNLIKYGDVYLRLFKESDYGDDILFNTTVDKRLDEDVILALHKDRDNYVNYIESIKNPGEMFELVRFGKTMGYIQAPVNIQNIYDENRDVININDYTQYKMKKRDVTIYQATDFVHAAIEDTSSRTAEEIDIYLNEDDYEKEVNSTTYNVRRGQSLLYNLFKVWRLWKLVENSIMLNRVTKTSVVRLMQVEVGDMPKESVRNTIRQIKQMVEQKTALNTNNSISEYTNPGAVENTIYIPTKGEIGKIQTETLGTNDTDPKNLLDLEYLRDLFFAATRIPKQFFGFVGDDAGFSGGESLAIISSRYGKAVKRIQNTMIQALTDAINLMLLDRGLNSYVNKFVLKMQAPITKELKERREDKQNEVRAITDLTQVLNEQIENPVIRLKLLKELLMSSTQNPDIISLIQEQIDELENGKTEEEVTEEQEESIPDMNLEDEEDFDLPTSGEASSNENEEEQPGLEPIEDDVTFGESLELKEDDKDHLPSFSELEVEDGSDTTLFD